MDGVIFNTENIWRDADYYDNKLYNITIDEKLRQSFCGKSELEIKEELKKLYNDLDVDQLLKQKEEYKAKIQGIRDTLLD